MNAIPPRPSLLSTTAASPGDAVLVVFDLDGTLVDTAPDLSGALNHCLELAELPTLSVEALRPHAGRGARAMLEEGYRQGGRIADESELRHAVPLFLAHYEAHIADASRPFPGAVDALDRLAAAGLQLAVCTNKTEALARRLLEALGLDDRFAAICGSDSFAGRKPDPVHLLGTLALAAGTAARSVMVGDTDTDIEAARRAGLASVLVDFGYDPCPLARAKAGRIVSSFEALDAGLIHDLLAEHTKAGVSAIDGARAFA